MGTSGEVARELKVKIMFKVFSTFSRTSKFTKGSILGGRFYYYLPSVARY
jgi:hypothetical protein